MMTPAQFEAILLLAKLKVTSRRRLEGTPAEPRRELAHVETPVAQPPPADLI
jgi:hypothetical protein